MNRTEIAGAEAAGLIVAQTPAPGTTLLPGDTVSLQISAGGAVPAATVVQSSTASNGPAPLYPLQNRRSRVVSFEV